MDEGTRWRYCCFLAKGMPGSVTSLMGGDGVRVRVEGGGEAAA